MSMKQASAKMQRATKKLARQLGCKTDDEDGHWVTTRQGNHLFIGDDSVARTGPDGKVIDEIGSGRFDKKSYSEARKAYRKSKGIDLVVNRKLVSVCGVKIDCPKDMEELAIQAAAHIASESTEAMELSKCTLVLKPLSGKYGQSNGNRLFVDSTSVKEHGPGFAASIVRHELEHTLLTRKGIPTGKQESKVRHTAGMWAAYKYGWMAKTNPTAAKGFAHAARLQGVKVK